jgi:tetratricopeptide (TPR) repeat protein
MKLFRSRGRDDGAQTASSPLAEARALLRAGRYAEAEAEARAMAAHDPRYAPLALSITARAADAQGRHAEALAEYDAALPVFGSSVGAEHLQTLVLRSNRAQVLFSLARYAECETECAAVARAAARVSGPETALLASAALNGQIYAINAQGRHQEAEALAREALAAHQTPDRLTVVLRLGLARSLNGQARHEDALAEAERAAELYRGLSEDERRPEIGAVEFSMATALLGLDRGLEARPLAAAAFDACVAAFGPDHYRTSEIRALLDRIDNA